MSIATARQDQADGLGYCVNCGHEYKTSEDVYLCLNWPDDKSGEWVCPKCQMEKNHVLYWCNLDMDEPLHTPNQCNLSHRDS